MTYKAQSLYLPLQKDFRFLYTPLPAFPSAFLTVDFPIGRNTGLPLYEPNGLGSPYPPTAPHP
jgi:hypothetical protein